MITLVVSLGITAYLGLLILGMTTGLEPAPRPRRPAPAPDRLDDLAERASHLAPERSVEGLLLWVGDAPRWPVPARPGWAVAS